MKRNTIATLGFVVMANVANAALPPNARNSLDLNVMVDFIKTHPVVLGSLKNIDLDKKVVIYKKFNGKKWVDCTAEFFRKSREFNGPGPAGDLYFDSSDCPIE